MAITAKVIFPKITKTNAKIKIISENEKYEKRNMLTKEEVKLYDKLILSKHMNKIRSENELINFRNKYNGKVNKYSYSNNNSNKNKYNNNKRYFPGNFSGNKLFVSEDFINPNLNYDNNSNNNYNSIINNNIDNLNSNKNNIYDNNDNDNDNDNNFNNSNANNFNNDNDINYYNDYNNYDIISEDIFENKNDLFNRRKYQTNKNNNNDL
jgi:hypothetical protein